MPSDGILCELQDNFAILGYAEQDKNGLFYIHHDGKTNLPTALQNEGKMYKAMMAAVAHDAIAIHHSTLAKRHEGNDKIDSQNEVSRKVRIVTKTFSFLTLQNSQSNTVSSDITEVDFFRLWHSRLGHAIPFPVVKSRIRDGTLLHPKYHEMDCENCVRWKFQRSFRGSLTKSTQIGTLHMDTEGSLEADFIHEHKYFFMIDKEFNRYVAVPPIKSKADASDTALWFVK